ncbi:hypothetical protein B0T14DRAFT_564047 [Immersiella caudata]|uniref:Uncharacterized protein n=1 Tax=Immersiella caudata TaxID=314043 RepID=A0AA39WVW9_9PEZI|nr:hypothetical protein B0T14DRAFT_564047 [Immersiella caudata]
MSSETINTVINAPEPQLRVLVQALLTSDDVTLRNKVLAVYWAVQSGDPQDKTNKRKAEFDQDDGSSANASGTSNNVQTCVRCKQSFTPSSGSMNFAGQQCLHHPGELLFDEESQVWREWEYSEMDMDTMESRQDFPEGFKYSCCRAPGDAKGCKLGEHVARPKKRQ